MTDRFGKSSALVAALVFVVFAVCILLVLLLGAGVYQNLTEAGEQRYSDWVPAQYLSTRIRQAQSVSVEDFQGCPALVLGETLEGECYVTRVYLWEGYLRELYSSADAVLEPEDGEKLLAVRELELDLDGSLLHLGINGRELFFHIRKEVAP